MAEINNNTAGDRLAKWDLNYDPDRIFVLNNLYRPKQKLHAAEKFAALADVDVRIKQVVSGLGLPVKDIASYLSFGRQVWSKQLKIHGETLKIEVQTMVDLWVARGMVQSALEAIRTQVFDITAPIGP